MEYLKAGLAQCGLEGLERIVAWIEAGKDVLCDGEILEGTKM